MPPAAGPQPTRPSEAPKRTPRDQRKRTGAHEGTKTPTRAGPNGRGLQNRRPRRGQKKPPSWPLTHTAFHHEHARERKLAREANATDGGGQPGTASADAGPSQAKPAAGQRETPGDGEKGENSPPHQWSPIATHTAASKAPPRDATEDNQARPLKSLNVGQAYTEQGDIILEDNISIQNQVSVSPTKRQDADPKGLRALAGPKNRRWEKIPTEADPRPTMVGGGPPSRKGSTTDTKSSNKVGETQLPDKVETPGRGKGKGRKNRPTLPLAPRYSLRQSPSNKAGL